MGLHIVRNRISTKNYKVSEGFGKVPGTFLEPLGAPSRFRKGLLEPSQGSGKVSWNLLKPHLDKELPWFRKIPEAVQKVLETVLKC